MVFGNLVDELSMANSMAHLQAWVSSQFDPSVSWQDLAWVREQWQGKLIIKGVMTADDARLASEYGVDGIIVSNHGGRQLDTVPATINAIEGVVQAAGTHVDVMMDSGIRSGLDILKARAMGADGCLIGRAWVYALAARGEEGVDQMLTNLKEELRIAMALTGNQSAKGIARDSIIRP